MKKGKFFRMWSFAMLLIGTAALADAASIEMPTVNIDRNGTATVQLNINDGNTAVFNYQAFQFDLFLPDGITVDSYSLDATLTSAGFDITQTNPSVGTYRYIAFSSENDVTTANFMTLVLKADNTVVTGDLTAKIQNVVFSAPSGQDINLTNSQSTISVNVPVTDIILNKTSITLYTGTEFQLTATLDPSDSTDTHITWASSAPTIAKVESDGTVKALQPGTANITATCDGKTATCVVTVKNVVSGGEGGGEGGDDDVNIGVTPGTGTTEGDDDDTPGGNTEDGGSLIGNNLTLRVGQTAAINLTIDPAPEYDPNFQWALAEGGDAYVTMTLNPDNSLTASFTGLSVGETIYTVSLPNTGETVLAGNIKVIATNPVTTITLSPSPLSMPLNSEPVQINATIAPANASIQALVWSTSDDKVATVSADGKVSPVALGECDITATTTDGSGIFATCHVTVTPVVPVSITISGENIHTLKTTGTLQLTATVAPDDTTYPEFTWSSLQPDLATVSPTGLVTAIAAGTVTIKATVDKYPDVYDEYQIVITDRLIGDANDNGTVNVADIVTILDFINERQTWQFSFVNADVNNSGDITVLDVEGVLNIIRGEIPQPVSLVRRSRAKAEDTLYVDNFATDNNQLQTIGLTLDGNSHRYSSMQAKIRVPEGMEIEDVKLGNGAVNHNLDYNITEDGTIHVVVYSYDSTPFASAYAPLLQVAVRANADCTDLSVDGILFANSSIEEYALDYAGGRNTGIATGIDTIGDGSLQISAEPGLILVTNGIGLDINVYSVSGQTVTNRKATSAIEKISLGAGVYVVKAGEKVVKVVL